MYGIMTWFPVKEIFGPVGPEKMVICDRSALAERSRRGGHWPSESLRFAETTGYVHAGRFRMTNGHPYGEDMALHRRGRCPHRPAPGRLRPGEWICAKSNPPHRWCGRRADEGIGPYDVKSTGPLRVLHSPNIFNFQFTCPYVMTVHKTKGRPQRAALPTLFIVN